MSAGLHLSNPPATVDAAAFKSVMRQLPGGVAILAAGCGNAVSGMTVTSLVSLSVEPPTVLVAINRKASSWPLLVKSGAFAVSLLSANDVELAGRFSGQGGLSGPQRFDREQWSTLSTGAPILRSAPAALDCEAEMIVSHHTHAIVVGRVVGLHIAEAGRNALAYWNGRYVVIENDDAMMKLLEACFPVSRGLWDV